MTLMINPEVRETVNSELRSGEKLLWADKPSKFPLTFMAVYVTVFSAIWTLMALSFVGIGAVAVIFGTGAAESSSEAASTAGVSIIFSIFSLVFVGVGVVMFLYGLKMLIGPSREIYAVTDQRGIIISPFIKYRVATLSAEVLSNSERKGRPDLGTLTFTNKSTGWLGMWMNPYQTDLSAFRKVTNPKVVEDLIHKTFSK